jgi:ATP-dependent RNA helicase RhlE
VLVATDIAARGIDIDQLPQVVNFELPNVPEDYVHRIGRTGRAGSVGSALSLVDSEEMGYLKDIEKLIKRNIVRVEVEGFVPTPRAESAPDIRPPRPPQRPSGNQANAGRRQEPGRARQRNKPSENRNEGQRADKPETRRETAPRGPQSAKPGQARRPKPQAALFTAKPGSRGH